MHENIYLEQTLLNEEKKSVWNRFINAKEFQSLFTEEKKEFKQGDTGLLNWTRFLFFKVSATYEDESYQECMNLLIKISSPKCSSLLLITMEENRDGVLLRMDHRSFFGPQKIQCRTSFLKRWEKLLKNLSHKNISHK